MNIIHLETGSHPGPCLRLEGDCDLYSVPAAYRALEGELRDGGALHLDFGAVSYLDSCGVGMIIRLLQAARIMRTEVTFSGLAGSPRKVLAMSNILPILKESPCPMDGPR